MQPLSEQHQPRRTKTCQLRQKERAEEAGRAGRSMSVMILVRINMLPIRERSDEPNSSSAIPDCIPPVHLGSRLLAGWLSSTRQLPLVPCLHDFLIGTLLRLRLIGRRGGFGVRDGDRHATEPKGDQNCNQLRCGNDDHHQPPFGKSLSITLVEAGNMAV